MLNQDTRYLLSFLQEKNKQQERDNFKPKVSLETAVGLLAFLYERVRNLIDYQEEHLLLRRAITRILVRRTKTEKDPERIIRPLINELLMARYLLNNYLPEEKIPIMENVLKKYFLLYQKLGQKKLTCGEDVWEFLLSLAGREIEEILTPSFEDQLLNYALKQVGNRVVWQEEGEQVSEQRKTRMLVGLMRALSKYDDRTIYYKLWKLYFPDWLSADEKTIDKTSEEFIKADLTIQGYISEKYGEPITRVLKKYVAPFEILRDLINRKQVEVEATFSSPEELSKAAFAAANSRYHRALSSLRRSAINSFVYIFITKMAFAFALEVPYELYFSAKVNYLPIVINLLFPPSLMLFMALTVESPKSENTQKIVNEILSMSYNTEGPESIRINLGKRESKLMTYFFWFFYLLAFVVTFGLTVYLLRILHFSIVSLFVFFFFLSTVSFFAFRIRSAFKELVVGEEGSNLVSIIFDFFMLPFIRLGRSISSGLSEINIFVFIFDIIVEAPFKMVLETIEAISSFLREKKEEALNVIK